MGANMIVTMAWAAAIASGTPLLLLGILLLMGGPRRIEVLPDRVAPPFALLMPAHDEAAGIGAALAVLRPHLRECDRLVVVADNCTDDTAAIARAAGAEVIERDDPARIGKGYALAAGRDRLALDPPPVVILLDADCGVGVGALTRLSLAAARFRAAVQGRYLLTPPEDASALVRVSCFAFLLKNLIRQRALARMGAPALLQGSGMAFPWPLFATAPLASGSLVEDAELGLSIALAGGDVRFEEGAAITSSAAAVDATRAQRRRWEHGMTAVTVAWLPRLILAGLAGRPRLLALAADLAVPPLTMLALIAIAGIVCAVPAAISGTVAPLALLLSASLFAVGAMAPRWWRDGRALLPAADLMRLPAYLVWKLPVVAGLLRGRERTWRRTARA